MWQKQHRLTLLSLIGCGVWGIRDEELLQHGLGPGAAPELCSLTALGFGPWKRPFPSDCCVWGHWGLGSLGYSCHKHLWMDEHSQTTFAAVLQALCVQGS